MSDSKTIELEDARARIKELEDQLNEKLIENTNTHLKIKEAEDRSLALEKSLEIMKNEYNWLRDKYDMSMAEIYDKLDELGYSVKHTNYTEVIGKRNEEIIKEREKQAQEATKKADEAVKKGKMKVTKPDPKPDGYE